MPDYNGVDEDLAKEILNDLGLDLVEIHEVEELGSSETSLSVESVEDLLASDIPDELREVVEGLLEDYETISGFDISMVATYYEIVDYNGEVFRVTRIEMQVDVPSDYVGDVDDLILVLNIPKDVVTDTSMIVGDYSVLLADPVIKFDSDAMDSESVFYFRDDVVNDVDLIMPITLVEKPEPVVEPTVEVVPLAEPNNVTIEFEEFDGIGDDIRGDLELIVEEDVVPGLGGRITANTPTIVGVLIGLLVIGIILFLTLRRKEEE